MARVEDESLGYVLPNHMLLHIADVLPREQQGIIACCNPIPPLVKQQLNELHLMILKAREIVLEKVSSARKSLPATSEPAGDRAESHDFVMHDAGNQVDTTDHMIFTHLGLCLKEKYL